MTVTAIATVTITDNCNCMSYPLFSGRYKESGDDIISMKGIKASGLEVILECMYTTSLNLTVDNILDVYPVAELLQNQDVLRFCNTWLKENISPEHCLSWLKMAEEFNNEDLISALQSFIMTNLTHMDRTSGFSDISRQAMCKYLSFDGLCSPNGELDVYKTAERWLDQQENPHDDVCVVMKHIRFAGINANFLIKEVMGNDMIMEKKECRDLVSEALGYHSDLYGQPLYNGRLNKPRGMVGLVSLSLAYDNGGRSGMHGYQIADNFTKMTLTSLEHKIHICRNIPIPFVYESKCVVPVNNFLFLFAVDNRCSTL